MDARHTFIVLGTYNGSKYLPDQLRSIQEQSQRDWTLLVRDDGSTDGTCELVRQFCRTDGRIELLEDSRGRLRPAANYGVLLEEALRRGADYIFCSDQDDVWHPDKLERQLATMSAAERKTRPGTPVLVHSDLTVVDDALRVIHPSFMQHQRIRHEEIMPLNTLLVQNFVTGCTCLLNRPLVKACLPLPESIVMHDWWMALCAAAWGEIHFLNQPTLLYRQHGRNEVGAVGFWSTLNIWRKSWHIVSKESLREFSATVAQARALRNHLETAEAPPATALNLVRQYVDLFDREGSTFRRARSMQRLGIKRQDFVRNALLMCRLMGVHPAA